MTSILERFDHRMNNNIFCPDLADIATRLNKRWLWREAVRRRIEEREAGNVTGLGFIV